MNLLLTSVGRRSYMVRYFKALAAGQVHALNSEWTYAMQVADVAAISPLIYDPSYVEFVLAYCDQYHIDAVLSLFDIDLPVLSLSKERFREKKIKLIVSDSDFIEICNDKYKAFKWLNTIGLNTPKTYLNIDACLIDVSKKKISYPLIIKPRWGMGSIGVYEAANEKELFILHDKVKTDIISTYLKYESKADYDLSVIIQEKLCGEEYGLDVFNDLDGNFLSCVPKRKLAMRAGETDSAIVIKDEQLVEMAKVLSIHSRHIGNLDVDCFKVNGEYHVLEMNARFGGQYPFSHLAGVNYPKVIMDMIQNKRVEQNDLFPDCDVMGFKSIEPVLVCR